MEKNNDNNKFSFIWGSGLLLLIMCIFIGGLIKDTYSLEYEDCDKGTLNNGKCVVVFEKNSSSPTETFTNVCSSYGSEWSGSCDSTPYNFTNNLYYYKCSCSKNAVPVATQMVCIEYVGTGGVTMYKMVEYAAVGGGTIVSSDKCTGSATSCKLGEYLDNGTCKKCEAGSWCDGKVKHACTGSNTTSPAGSDEASDCVCQNGTYMGTGGYCIACEAGYYCSGGNKTACPSGKYSSSGAAYCMSCANLTAGYYCSGGKSVLCEAGYYCSGGVRTACPSGRTSLAGSKAESDCRSNQCTVGTYYSSSNSAISAAIKKCGNGNYTLKQEVDQGCYTISCTEPCDCGDDGDCSNEFSACWQCSDGYKYGTNTNYESTCKQVNTSYCSSGGYSGCWQCSDGYKYGTNTQYASSCKQVSSSYCSSNPSSSTPSSSSSSAKPSSSSSSVRPTPSSSSTRPSSSSKTENVEKNPQTGEIAVFIVWFVAFAAIAYSIYYFKKIREN